MSIAEGVALVCSGASTMVLGGPGRGKSTMAHKVTEHLYKVKGTVVISAASTGKAAEHIPQGNVNGRRFPGMTVHSTLLQKDMWESVIQSKPRHIVVMVDEVFMLNADPFIKLLRKLKRVTYQIQQTFPGHRLAVQWVFTGDECQLQSVGDSLLTVVEFTNWLAEAKVVFCTLTEHQRFKACAEYVELVDALERRDARRVVEILSGLCVGPARPSPPPGAPAIFLGYTNKEVQSYNMQAQRHYAGIPGALVYVFVHPKTNAVLWTAARGSNLVSKKNMKDADGRLVLTNGSICVMEAVVGTACTLSQVTAGYDKRAHRFYFLDKELKVDVLKDEAIQTVCARKESKEYLVDLKNGDGMTVHMSQGMTFKDKPVTCALGGVRDWQTMYVMLTRAEFISQLRIKPFAEDLIYRLAAAPLPPEVRAFQQRVRDSAELDADGAARKRARVV